MMMIVRIYTTDLPLPMSEVHPLAIIPDRPEAQLPNHPQGLLWRYWVTTDTRDTLLVPFRERVERAIENHGHCLMYEPLDRLLSPLPLNRFRHRTWMIERSAPRKKSQGRNSRLDREPGASMTKGSRSDPH